MALYAYMNLKGQKQGDIKGSVTQKGREGMIKVIATDHEIVSPRDAASGLATGKRQHKPLIIVKEVDKSTPLLYNVLVNNENITELVLQFWRASTAGGIGGGTEVQFYTIKLINASIAAIRHEMLNSAYPENAALLERERIAVTYQKITWTWNDGGITAEDDWEAPGI